MLYNEAIPDWDNEETNLVRPRYVEWWPDATKVRIPRITLRDAGWKKVNGPVYRLSVKTYLDVQTGELISKRDMFRRKLPVPRNASLRWIEQLCAVNRLGKRAKDLCLFLLRMRNNRGSFILPLQDLIDGYIHRNGTVVRLARARQQAGKLVTAIAAEGIIAQEQALGSLFQRNGRSTPHSVLEESAIWYAWPGIFRGKSMWAS